MFNRQGHTYLVPGPHKPLDLGPMRAILGHLDLETGVHWQDEHVIAVLNHADCQSGGKGLRVGVEVAVHCIAPPPPHGADCVQIHLGR